jgi:hypothetical protein
MMLKKTIAASLFAIGSCAGAAETNPVYVGANVGLHNSFSNNCSYYCDERAGNSGKVYAGYVFGIGTVLQSSVEVAGFANEKSRALAGGGDNDLSLRGGSAVYKAAFKLSDTVSLNARLGVAYVDSVTDDRNANMSNSEGKFGATGGVGLAYALDPHWSLTADVDRLKVGYAGIGYVNTVALGAGYRF